MSCLKRGQGPGCVQTPGSWFTKGYGLWDSNLKRSVQSLKNYLKKVGSLRRSLIPLSRQRAIQLCRVEWSLLLVRISLLRRLRLRDLKDGASRLVPWVFVGVILMWKRDDSDLSMVWVYRWVLFTVLLAWVTSHYVARLTDWTVSSICCAYFVSVGALGAMGMSRFQTLDSFDLGDLLTPQLFMQLQGALKLSAAHTTIVLSLLILFTLAVRARLFLFPLKVSAVAIAVSIYLTENADNAEIAFLHNPSVSGSFIAVLAPSLAWPLALFIAGAVIKTKASTPLLALFIGVGVRYWDRWKRYVGEVAFVGSLAVIGIPSLYFSSSGRSHVWLNVWQWWRDQGPACWWIGTGAGATPLLVPMIQHQFGLSGESDQYFLWLHSDWLQILFEFGILGLLAALLIFFDGLHRARRTPIYGAMLASFGACMVTNFPLRYPLFCFLGVVILGCIYNEETR